MSKAIHSYEQELKLKFQETRLPHIQLQAKVLKIHEERSAQKINKRIFRKILLPSVYSIIAFVLLCGVLASFPASAEQLRKIPVMGKMFEGDIFSFAGDSGIIKSKDSELTSSINEKVSDQGVTIKLQDAIYDGTRLSIGYEINSEQFNHLMFLGDVSVKINGISKPEATIGTKPHRIQDNHYTGILTLNVDSIGLDDRFELELTIGEVSGPMDENLTKYNQVAGEWSFNASITNHTLDHSRHITLTDKYMAKSKNGQFRVTNYSLTPITTMINYEFIGEAEWLLFQLKHEQGMLIQHLDSGSSTDKDGNQRGFVRFAPLTSDTKEIYVAPYILLAHQNEIKKVTSKLSNEFPIALSQGKVGEVIVQTVEFTTDKTLIYYEVKGKVPYAQYASLWLETADGQMIISDSGVRTRVSDTSYEYILEYPPLDPQQSYVIGTMTQTDINLLDELTIRIELE